MTPASTADLRDLLNADDTLLYFFWIQALIACLEDPVRSFMSAMAATIFSVEKKNWKNVNFLKWSWRSAAREKKRSTGGNKGRGEFERDRLEIETWKVAWVFYIKVEFIYKSRIEISLKSHWEFVIFQNTLSFRISNFRELSKRDSSEATSTSLNINDLDLKFSEITDWFFWKFMTELELRGSISLRAFDLTKKTVSELFDQLFEFLHSRASTASLRPSFSLKPFLSR